MLVDAFRRRAATENRIEPFPLCDYVQALVEDEEQRRTKRIVELREHHYDDHTSPYVDSAIDALQFSLSGDCDLQKQARLGYRYLNGILGALKKIDLTDKRSEDQIEACNRCIASIAHHLFGDATDGEIARVMKILRVSQAPELYVCEMPRRRGKSVMMAMATASVMYVVPEVSFLVYSVGQRCSSSYHALVQKYLTLLCDGKKNRFVTFNKDTIEFRPIFGGADALSKMKNFPSNPNTLRGQGEGMKLVAVMDEGNFIPQKVVNVAILPPVMREGAALWCISSKGDRSERFCSITDVVREMGIVDVHTVTPVCSDCRRNGISTNCIHASNPPWLAVGPHADKVKMLMNGDVRTYAREIENADVGGLTEPAFNRHETRRLAEEPKSFEYLLASPVEQIVIAIDPAAGGKSSAYAIVSLAFIQHRGSSHCVVRRSVVPVCVASVACI